MKTSLRLLTLILSISFCAQAMQEVKMEAESYESKEVIELRELRRILPASVSFLVKILGAQKTKQKTLLEKINPFTKGESEVLKIGLPNDLILKIINNYLRIDKVLDQDINSVINSNDMINSTFLKYKTCSIKSEGDIDWMDFSSSGRREYVLMVGKYHARPKDMSSSLFQFMDHSVLDINPKLNTGLELIVQRTQDNKYKVIAGFIGAAGLTYYLIKKFRR